MMTYAPLSIEKYHLVGTTVDEIMVIKRSTLQESLWNMFWLSTPSIDAVPQAGKDWWRTYRPKDGALASMIRDIADDQVLEEKLWAHPYAFLEWFQDVDHTAYRTHATLGPDWVATVCSRAESVGARMTLQAPALSVERGKFRIRINVSA